jgi:peptidoglycan LD-endopeptidase LytH
MAQETCRNTSEATSLLGSEFAFDTGAIIRECNLNGSTPIADTNIMQTIDHPKGRCASKRTAAVVMFVAATLGLSMVSAPTTLAKSSTTTTTVATTDVPVARLVAANTIAPSTEITAVPAGVDGDDEPTGTDAEIVAPPATVDGWVCPVPNAKFTNDWGQARPGGRSHTGTDLLAPMGSPIFAPIAGIVTFKGSSRGGNSFYLKSATGLTIFGAHLSRYGEGGKVRAGTVIGYVGDSGNAKGTPHLHFEMQYKGRGKANPYATLKSVCQ